ncbi:AraC family transcriptional regulator [Rhizobium sp. CC-YZS058]|uniref:AraC family transcriptional regulator n=1 Tax=Rhizobium sp. CC-YZS058 TaxID=3042153 RepID=UPI002B05C014|nr:AraC family transcriptional regulator [Rhizobium sp. CC-YZS058]MEA3537011.1 AraC family transcriptional regulator [Rhizobium sp. CC-YZS058]
METEIASLGVLADPLTRPGQECASTGLEVPGLGVWHSSVSTASEPAMFDPRLYVVLRGTKTMAFAGRHTRLTPGMCALSSIGVPFVTRVEAAPYLGIGLQLNTEIVGRIMPALPERRTESAASIDVGQMDESLIDPLKRMLAMCRSQGEAEILGPLVVEEVHYRLLTGRFGDTVRQLMGGGRRMEQIREAVAVIRAIDDPLPDVGELARTVGMSVASFHRHFKLITGHGPLDYAKHLRLLRARELLYGGGVSVAEAAGQVGYVSASQFSREYKRKFGTAPHCHARRPGQSVALP